jgi:transcriptional regulator with GAF, ATPase, and Fis domain
MNLADASREIRLCHAFVRLADTLVNDFDVVDLLSGLVGSCVELLDVAAAGLVLADGRGQLRVMASSSEQTRLLELFELQNDEGPCLDCYRTGQPVVEVEMSAQDARWPHFAPEARARGYEACYAVPMRLRHETIGALNLFCAPGVSISRADLDVGQAFADVATIAVLHQRALRRKEQLVEQLQTALNSRVSIEQAKGVIAERERVDMDQAFSRLRAYARNNNRKLSDIAVDVVTGQLNIRDATSAAESPPGDR